MKYSSNVGSDIISDFTRNNRQLNKISTTIALIFSVVPPISYLSVTSDIISAVVLGGAVIFPVFILLATSEKTKHLMQMKGGDIPIGVQRMILIFGLCVCSIFMVIESKMLITWFGHRGIFNVVDRVIASFVGAMLGCFCVSVLSGLSALAELADSSPMPLTPFSNPVNGGPPAPEASGDTHTASNGGRPSS